MAFEEWAKLRSWKNSKNLAFEELCCQLARAENIPGGKEFIKNEAPDGGIEGYWLLNNGTQIGWQAKYFTEQPTASQWDKIKNSLFAAVRNYPNLIEFITCCAVDLTIKSRQKWYKYVETWSKQIKETTGREIEIKYWGTSQIVDRLSQERHRGRMLFWFNEDILSLQRMGDNIEEVIANVGARYTKELNIELDIAHNFEALGRTKEYHYKLRKKIGEFKREIEIPLRNKKEVSFISDIYQIKEKAYECPASTIISLNDK